MSKTNKLDKLMKLDYSINVYRSPDPNIWIATIPQLGEAFYHASGLSPVEAVQKLYNVRKKSFQTFEPDLCSFKS